MVYCPYCEKPFPRKAQDIFEACPSCGYRSAQFKAAGGEYLIIDSMLPDMMSKYKEILDDCNDLVVVIDRRVRHDVIAGTERRRRPSSWPHT